MKIKINKQLILEAYQMAMTSKDANNHVVDNSSDPSTVGALVGTTLINPYALPLGYYGRQQDPYKLANQSSIPNHEGYDSTLDKKAIRESTNLVQEDGAWDKSMRAKNTFYNNLDNQYSQNFENNPGHYFLNPTVAGPLSHGLIKGQKAINNGVYRLFKGKDSPDVNNDITVAADTKDNPFNSNMDVIRASSNNYADDIKQIRKDHPGHYYTNPFTSGPLNSLQGHLSGAIGKGVRSITSPNSTAGDTLVHNTGRRLG